MNTTPTAALWHTNFEPELVEPNEGANEEAVATFIDEMRGEFGVFPPSGSVGDYCIRHHYLGKHPFKVAKVETILDELSALTRRAALGPILHDANMWERLYWTGRVPDWVLRCPRLIWCLNKKTGAVTYFRDPCENWSCEECASRRAAEHLLWASQVFLRAKKLWVSIVPFDEALMARLRARRMRAGGAGGLAVHRSDTETLHIYSSVDLSKGRTAPTAGEWMTSREALKHLHGVTLCLPGIGRQPTWTGHWKRPARPQTPSRSFRLGEVPLALAEEALAQAQAQLDGQYGVNAMKRLSSEEIETMWLPIVEAAIQRQWDLRQAEGGEAE